MIDRISMAMAIYVKSKAPEDHPASVAVLRHALAILLNMVMIIAIVLIVTAVTNTFRNATIAMFSFAVLRQITGGYHLKSGMWCVAVSSLLFIGISLIDLPQQTTVLLTLISAILCAMFAPSDIEKQSRIPSKYYPLLNILGIIIVFSNLFIGSAVVALSFFIQTLLLIRWRR